MKKDALSVAKELVKILEELHKENMVMLSELKPGDKFSTGIGNFIVLEQKEDCAVIITEKLYMEDEIFDADCNDYKKSQLREKFDGEILDEFIAEFGEENIYENETGLVTVDGQKAFGKLLTKVRPLTFDEAREYNDLLADEDLPDWYWTCTPWSTKERGWGQSVAIVSPRGYFSNCSCDFYYVVRPVCILKSNLFVSRVKED
mgnify:CR=1 FL=1